MFDDAGFVTPLGVFVLAAIRLLVWTAMMYVPLRFAGIQIRESLRVLTQPEAILFGLYAIAAALAAGGLFSD